MSAKDEALRSLQHLNERLLLIEPTLEIRLMIATLEYAVEQVAQIQEVKRVRKPSNEISGAAGPLDRPYPVPSPPTEAQLRKAGWGDPPPPAEPRTC
jgi:hypothetical protein